MLDISMLSKDRETGLLEFSKELDLSYAKLWNKSPFANKVKVSGNIQSVKEILDEYIVTYTVDYNSNLPCARCLTEISKTHTNSFTHILRDTKEDPIAGSDYIPISGSKLDLEQMVLSDMLLETEEAPLCKPNCLGICPICGNDRNEEPCDCEPEYKDPRFDVLRKLLDKNN